MIVSLPRQEMTIDQSLGDPGGGWTLSESSPLRVTAITIHTYTTMSIRLEGAEYAAKPCPITPHVQGWSCVTPGFIVTTYTDAELAFAGSLCRRKRWK